jgi:hypothetical protein
MWLIALIGGDVRSFMHLHQLLAQSLPRRGSRRACVRAFVHVVEWVENCTRQVFYMTVQISTYTGTSVVNTTVYNCGWPYSSLGIHIHSCRCILFICTVQSLYYMRVYHRCFWKLACACEKGLQVGSFPACLWLLLVAGVLAGVEVAWRVFSCTFLYFPGC